MPKKLEIILTPKPPLRQVTTEVPFSEIKSKKIQELTADMKETLKHTPDGVGLAAPQVNEPLRIFIVSEEAEEIDRIESKKQKNDEKIDPNEDTNNKEPYQKRDWNYYVFINPVIKKISKQKLTGTEGCLSVPGKFGPVDRQEKITVEAYDEHGKKFTRGASRFFARVIQHELDHLVGGLFIDKAKEIIEVDKKPKN